MELDTIFTYRLVIKQNEIIDVTTVRTKCREKLRVPIGTYALTPNSFGMS